MQTILVFSTNVGRARADALSGMRLFAESTDWKILPIDYEGSPFPVSELIRFWHPIGCVVIGEEGFNCVRKEIKALRKTPVVYLGSTPNFTLQTTRVVHNAQATADFAARELLLRDAAQYAFVGFRKCIWSARRKDAFVRSMARNGKAVTTLDLVQGIAARGASESIRLASWLRTVRKPCGILAADDSIAETILSICNQTDLVVPDDIAVIGVDDNEDICEHTSPTLTSIRPDFRQAGWFAARLLAKKILGAQNVPEETVFSISGIIRRGSTRIMKHADKAVSDALDRLRKPDGFRLTAREILSKFPCSRRNAEFRFRKATGHSVLQELMPVRIEHAKQLLVNSTLSISAIANACGYRYPAGLIRAFSAETGLTPQRWRRQATAEPVAERSNTVDTFSGRRPVSAQTAAR